MAIAPVDDVVGTGTGEADLWCTYAAVRTLSWLGRLDEIPHAASTARYLRSRRNADGGYAWTRGMSSDAWATFYCTQALRDLGWEPDRSNQTGRWLADTWTGSAFGMEPGQNADVWATHFSVRTQTDVCHEPIADDDAFTGWLRGLQCADGGLSWTPGHADEGRSDVRACFYGVVAHARSGVDGGPPWNVEALVSWLRSMQDGSGGFRLHAEATTPCLWATYRAVEALRVLGAAPRDPAACRSWIGDRRGPAGGFVRWPDHDREDVWAIFCAVGALRALGVPTRDLSDDIVRRLTDFACPTGGFTYTRPAAAGDALTTSATLMVQPAAERSRHLRQWLEECLLPNEAGLMYMPGRGAEVRCTLWALAAGAYARDLTVRHAIAAWVADLQNPDGGFGYWAGRGSDLVSTASAIEILRLVEGPADALLDTDRLRAFVTQCGDDRHGYRNVPGGRVGLRPGLHAQRVLTALGGDCNSVSADLLARHCVTGGGFDNVGHRLPDLLTTYEAVLVASRLDLQVDTGGISRFVDRLACGDGTAWSPLATVPGGPLPNCLAELLSRWLDDQRSPLPALVLS